MPGGLTVVGSSRHDFSLSAALLAAVSKTSGRREARGFAIPARRPDGWENLLKGVYQPAAPRLRLRACNVPALKMSNKLRAVPSAPILQRQPQRWHLPAVAFSVVTLVDPQPGQVGCSRNSCSWVMVLVPMNDRGKVC